MAFTNKRLGGDSPLLTKKAFQERLGTIPAEKTVAEYINENKGIKISVYGGAKSESGVPTDPCGPETQYTQDTLWLVQQGEGETAQIYDEYIVAPAPDGAPTAFQWEKLGSHEIPASLVQYDADGNIIVGEDTYSFESVDVVLGDGSTESYTLLKEVVHSNFANGPVL